LYRIAKGSPSYLGGQKRYRRVVLPLVFKYSRPSFFKNLIADYLTLSKGFSFFWRQGYNLHACIGTTVIHSIGTESTLDKQQMTGFIGAINMGITWCTTLVAMRNHMLRNPFTPPVVEDEILAHEFILELFLIYLPAVLDDPALELVNLFKTFVFVVCAGFFAPDTAGTVHHQFPVFLIRLQFLFNDIQ
jgi:hypothetical protein